MQFDGFLQSEHTCVMSSQDNQQNGQQKPEHTLLPLLIPTPPFQW